MERVETFFRFHGVNRKHVEKCKWNLEDPAKRLFISLSVPIKPTF